jgi:hypothetical protein
MSMKIMCQCGAELTIKKFKGPREDIPVVEQCEGCTVQAYHVGWVDGDAATTEETDYDAVLALMARESV